MKPYDEHRPEPRNPAETATIAKTLVVYYTKDVFEVWYFYPKGFRIGYKPRSAGQPDLTPLHLTDPEESAPDGTVFEHQHRFFCRADRSMSALSPRDIAVMGAFVYRSSPVAILVLPGFYSASSTVIPTEAPLPPDGKLEEDWILYTSSNEHGYPRYI